MQETLATLRTACAAVTAAAIVLCALPVRAEDSAGLAHLGGSVTAWLGRAPASCVLTPYFQNSPASHRLRTSGHVAYFVGHAMDGDFKVLESALQPAWHEMILGGTEQAAAVDDPRGHAGAYHIGGTDMSEWGVLADEPDPPRNAPPMRADLSKVALGGNVHLGDSLATVTSALGLRTLVPTDSPACAGSAIVELCDWNVANCACPPTMHYQGSRDISGTIIFRAGRVVGLTWSVKCFAGG